MQASHGRRTARAAALPLTVAALLAPPAHAQTPGRPHGAEELPVLRPGEVHRGEITDDSPSVETPTLLRELGETPVLGQAYRIEVPEAGVYRVELRSYLFDAYLVLRDGEGEILGENDDGLIGLHSRLVLAGVRPEHELVIQACALHGQRGSFELRQSVTPLYER